MPNVEISQLKVFLAAAEEKNFSAAAKRLHLSQSAVSQNIQALEKAYGVELFIRRGRSVDLSEEGESILPTAREVINAARLLEDSLQNVNNEVGGELIIGCSTSAGKYLMPTLLSQFRRQYSAVLPRVKIMGRGHVFERLLNETIPMGITSKMLDHRNLESIPLFEDNVILITHPDHPWAEYGRALPADLVDQPIIVRENTSGTCEVVVEGLKAFDTSMDMLNIAMELGNAEAIEMSVEQGVGIAFVSEMVAARGLAMGRIKKIEIEGLDLRRTVYMARNINRPFTRAQSLFWNFAQSQYDNLNTDIWQSLANFTMPVNMC
jgi:DNA-binding transcriptional LysR family regulator